MWVMVDDADVHGCVCLFGRRRIGRADRWYISRHNNNNAATTTTITNQIHDEVILEGPDESKEEALAEVRTHTQPPSL